MTDIHPHPHTWGGHLLDSNIVRGRKQIRTTGTPSGRVRDEFDGKKQNQTVENCSGGGAA